MKHMIIGACLLLFCDYVFAQKETISLNLKKGSTYYHNIEAVSSLIQNFNGTNVNLKTAVNTKVAYLIKAAHDTVYDMDVRYETISMSIELPGNKLSFDASSPDSINPFTKVLRSILYKPFSMTMSRSGKIIAVKNLDDMFTSMFNESTQLDEAQKQQLKARLMESFGEKALKGSFEIITAIYPHEKVEVGKTWAGMIMLQSTVPAKITSVFELKEKSADEYLINGNGSIQSLDENSSLEMNGMTMKYKINGEMNSIIRIDKASGWINEAKFIQKMKGDLIVKGGALGDQEQSIPMETNSTTTYKSK